MGARETRHQAIKAAQTAKETALANAATRKAIRRITVLLPRRKSILEDAAYTGGDVPKKWINDRGHYNDGYNKALEDVLTRLKLVSEGTFELPADAEAIEQAEQALVKAEVK